MKNFRFFKNQFFLIAILLGVVNLSQALASQADTVYIYNLTAPVIDGVGDDVCWDQAEWQTIDQAWINWGDDIPTSDFQGAYKVTWSSETNLLYFLVRTVDDVLCDNYVVGETADNYNFDILEVFIDEDRSRGRHVFDDGTENAENAFAYHMHARHPASGESADTFCVQDIAGTGWGDRQDPFYNNHFEEFIIRNDNNVIFREFSLKVYDDSYVHSNPENSRVVLSDGKIMGLSLAYCDNDDLNEIPATRDNFYGSVWVPESAFNDHWQDAEYFGTVKIIDDGSSIPVSSHRLETTPFDVFPNPANNFIQLTIDKSIDDLVAYKVLAIDGRTIISSTVFIDSDGQSQKIQLQGVKSGTYILQISLQGQILMNNIKVIE